MLPEKASPGQGTERGQSRKPGNYQSNHWPLVWSRSWGGLSTLLPSFVQLGNQVCMSSTHLHQSLMPERGEAGSLTVGSMLCLLRVASCYLHLCLYLVPALKAHNPPDMRSVQTAKGGCVRSRAGHLFPFPKRERNRPQNNLGS